MRRIIQQVSSCLVVAVIASAAGAAQDVDNWRNANGELPVKSDTGLCWRDGFWTPATASPGCDGAPVPRPVPKKPAAVKQSKKPVAVPPPPMPAQAEPVPSTEAPVAAPIAASEKISYAADSFFASGKADLKPTAKAKLSDLSAKLQGADVTLLVTGYTDSQGNKAFNQNLSVKRAQAVKAYLASKGIDGNRITVQGKGEAHPVASNKTAAGRAKNRRVDVEVSGSRTVTEPASN